MNDLTEKQEEYISAFFGGFKAIRDEKKDASILKDIGINHDDLHDLYKLIGKTYKFYEKKGLKMSLEKGYDRGLKQTYFYFEGLKSAPKNFKYGGGSLFEEEYNLGIEVFIKNNTCRIVYRACFTADYEYPYFQIDINLDDVENWENLLKIEL